MHRILIGLAMLGAATSVTARERCSSAEVRDGTVTFSLLAKQQGDAAPVVNYVHVRVTDDDQGYALSVHYKDANGTLGPPDRLEVDANFTPSSVADAGPQRMRWRIAGEGWNPPEFWGTPMRRYSNPDKTDSMVSFPIAQGEPFPSRVDTLDQLRRGGLYEIVRVAQDGADLGSGRVRYPSESSLKPIYARARTLALANLAPCKPAVLISPGR